MTSSAPQDFTSNFKPARMNQVFLNEIVDIYITRICRFLVKGLF